MSTTNNTAAILTAAIRLIANDKRDLKELVPTEVKGFVFEGNEFIANFGAVQCEFGVTHVATGKTWVGYIKMGLNESCLTLLLERCGKAWRNDEFEG